jgi:hypothetical protein
LEQSQRTTEVKRPWIGTECWLARALCANGLYFLDDPSTFICQIQILVIYFDVRN